MHAPLASLRQLGILGAALVVLGGGLAWAEPPLSPEDLAKLDAALLDRTGPMKLRLEAALILSRVGTPEAVPALLEGLGDPELPVRAASARALGAVGDARAADGLFGRLRDPERFVRDEANDALVRLVQRGYGRAVAAATRHWDPEIRVKVAALGARLGPKLGQSLVAQAIADPDASVRSAGQAALATWPPPQLSRFLLAELDADSPAVRAASAQLLGEHHLTASVPALMKMLVSPRENAQTVAAARYALREMSDQVDAVKLVDQARHGARAERQMALSVLAAIHDRQAFELLVAALDDPDLSLRSAAAMDLAVLGDTRAATKLAVLAGRPENASIARELQNALARLQSAR